MADNVQITAGSGTTIATDDVGGVQFQRVKLDGGGDGVSAPIGGDATYGLDVDVTRVSGNVTVVQGTATNLKVDASGVAVPVTDNASSLTVDAPANAPVFVRLSNGAAAVDTIPVADGGGTLSVDDGGGSLTVDGTVAVSGTVAVGDGGGTLTVDDGAGSLTVDAPVGTPVFVRLSDGTNPISALPVTDNGGNLSVDDGGGSLTIDGTVTANQGTPAAAASAWPVKIGDGTNAATLTNVGADYGLDVNIIGGSGLGAQTDKSGFTEGSGQAAVVAGVLNDTISADPSEDQAAALRITAKRGLHVNLRNGSGTEIGTAGNPVRVDPTGSTTQPVSGTLTVNQGSSGGGLWNCNLTYIGGGGIAVAAVGIPKVGLTDEAGAAFSETNPLPTRQTYPDQTRFKYAKTYAATETDIALFTPSGGKRYVLLGIIISPTASGVVKIYDNTNAAANMHFQGTPNGTAPGSHIVITLPVPMPSEAVNNVLRYSTGAGAAGDITVWGYEC